MSYQGHVAAYQRALLNNPDYYIRSALLQLQYDKLARVVGFMQGDALSRILRTLSAVSPQMRLDAETNAWTGDGEDESVKTSARNEHLLCSVNATAETPATPQLSLSLWWAARCGLPVRVRVNNQRSDVLRALRDGAQLRLQSLDVVVTSVPACLQGDASGCDGRCNTVMCALPAFGNLQRLSITCDDAVYGRRAVSVVTKLLRNAAQLPIAEVEVSGIAELKELSALSGAPHLRSLTAKNCGLQSVSELASCPQLAKLDVSGNEKLRSVSSLGDAPCLEELDIQGCDVRNLDGLGRCAKLRVLDASSNSHLVTTRGLAGAPSLEVLHVGCCEKLRNLAGCGSCPKLRELDIQFSFEVEDFRGAAGAPSLRSINANGCGLASLEGLSSCPQLTHIDFSENDRFPDPSGLAGAPSLEFINATDTGLQNLNGLNRCPNLKEILIMAAERLEDISGLAGAPRLEKISAMNCQIHNVSGLGNCPMLAEVDLGNNDPLVDVSDLARCPNLKKLDLSGTSVTDISAFSPSVKVDI